jgi:cytochrome b involved in lipid metabolism
MAYNNNMTKKASAIIIFLESAFIIVLVITLFTTTANTNTLSQVTVIPATTTPAPTPVTTKPTTTITKPAVTTPTPKPVVVTPPPTPVQQPGTYTLAQVSQHGTAQNCWTTVNGNVYDVTSWIRQHPGGSGAIIGMCGRDASADYNGEHGGQRRPANELASFKIGTLAQ